MAVSRPTRRSTATASGSSPPARRRASTSARRRSQAHVRARAQTCSPAASPRPTSCATRGRSTSSTATAPQVWDVDGNEMFDFHNGFGSMVQGHAHPAIGRRDRRALRARHPLRGADRGRDRRRRGARAPLGPAAWRYTNSGSEATMDAIRIARALHRPRHDHEDLRLLPRPPRHGDGLDRRRVRQDRRPRRTSPRCPTAPASRRRSST